MALSPARISPPCRVFFAGMEGDTYSMSRAGWEFAVHEEPYYGRIRLIINHQQSGLQGMGECRESFLAVEWRHRGGELPIFFINQMATNLRVSGPQVRMAMASYRIADMTPSIAMIEDYALADLPLFAERAKPPTEELIVDPATVSELLEQIRKQQAPIQQEIRERTRRREIIPVQHASIYTLPLAA